MLLLVLLSELATRIAGVFISLLALEPDDEDVDASIDQDEEHDDYDDAERIRKWDRDDTW